MPSGGARIEAAGRVLPWDVPERAYESEEPRYGFFIRSGLSPSDTMKLRKIAVQLSMTVNMGMDALLSMPISDLLDTIKEVAEVVDDRKRIQASHQNRRRH